VSSTTTLAILAGSELGLVSAADPTHLRPAVATLSALVGLALIIARLVRLGFVRHFVSAPVLTGRRGSGSINCRSCVFRGLDSAARVHRHPQSADHGISSAMAACLGVLTLGTLKGSWSRSFCR